LDTLTGLEDVRNSPFLPVPELLFLEISSAGEFFLRDFMCENRLLIRNTSSSFSAVPSLSKISNFYVSIEISSSFVLILLTVSRLDVCFWEQIPQRLTHSRLCG
jgi:hypothetical protein